MKIQGVIGVFIVLVIIVAAILVGNFFFSTFLGINVDKIPPFFKTLIHLAGLAAVLYILKKVFFR